MRIAFYSPLKPPDHAVPSGDRRMAGLLMRALAAAGHEVELASRLRSFEGAGDVERQAAIRAAGESEATALVARWRNTPAGTRPAVWFTYHLYHKAPDWLGPAVSDALAIPYLVAEASYAPKQATGPWAAGHAAVAAAIAHAGAVLMPIRDDAECLRALVAAPERLIALAPFVDTAPYRAARAARQRHRARLAADLGVDDGTTLWLLTVAMMRPGDKLASYRRLGAALGRLERPDWRLVIVGDGPARAAVREALGALAPGRVVYAGARSPKAMPAFYAAADVYVWPAVNEAYGMALVEAQATGLPVVAGRVRGVPDVVRDGESGILAPPGDDAAFAAALGRLLDDDALRARLGVGAATAAVAHHGLEAAAATLASALAAAGARA
ncbi:MAG: glycosyltransferase family 4 protein [Alphaproteobacteria bacterium]